METELKEITEIGLTSYAGIAVAVWLLTAVIKRIIPPLAERQDLTALILALLIGGGMKLSTAAFDGVDWITFIVSLILVSFAAQIGQDKLAKPISYELPTKLNPD